MEIVGVLLAYLVLRSITYRINNSYSPWGMFLKSFIAPGRAIRERFTYKPDKPSFVPAIICTVASVVALLLFTVLAGSEVVSASVSGIPIVGIVQEIAASIVAENGGVNLVYLVVAGINGTLTFIILDIVEGSVINGEGKSAKWQRLIFSVSYAMLTVMISILLGFLIDRMNLMEAVAAGYHSGKAWIRIPVVIIGFYFETVFLISFQEGLLLFGLISDILMKRPAWFVSFDEWLYKVLTAKVGEDKLLELASDPGKFIEIIPGTMIIAVCIAVILLSYLIHALIDTVLDAVFEKKYGKRNAEAQYTNTRSYEWKKASWRVLIIVFLVIYNILLVLAVVGTSLTDGAGAGTIPNYLDSLFIPDAIAIILLFVFRKKKK